MTKFEKAIRDREEFEIGDINIRVMEKGSVLIRDGDFDLILIRREELQAIMEWCASMNEEAET